MDDSCSVSSRQAFRDLYGVLENLMDWQSGPSIGKERAKVFPIQELHNQEWKTVVFSHIEHCTNSRVIELRRCPTLAA
jgi:hypothetical protein